MADSRSLEEAVRICDSTARTIGQDYFLRYTDEQKREIAADALNRGAENALIAESLGFGLDASISRGFVYSLGSHNHKNVRKGLATIEESSINSLRAMVLRHLMDRDSTNRYFNPDSWTELGNELRILSLPHKYAALGMMVFYIRSQDDGFKDAAERNK